VFLRVPVTELHPMDLSQLNILRDRIAMFMSVGVPRAMLGLTTEYADRGARSREPRQPGAWEEKPGLLKTKAEWLCFFSFAFFRLSEYPSSRRDRLGARRKNPAREGCEPKKLKK
jgi:hypothetical protein